MNLCVSFHVPVCFRFFLVCWREYHNQGASANNISIVIDGIEYMSSNIFLFSTEGDIPNLGKLISAPQAMTAVGEKSKTLYLGHFVFSMSQAQYINSFLSVP